MRQNKDWWVRAKFCSARCMQAARKPEQKICPSCGVEFQPKQGPARPQTYCSLSCAMTGRGINPVTSRYRRVRKPEGSTTLHRAMMEDALGVILPPDIVVHHKDQNKLHNRLSNFETMTNAEHGRLHNPPKNPVTSKCAICGTIFTPHKTKRGRKQTCSPSCKSALLKKRWPEHHPKQ